MKKLFIISSLLLSFAFTSCNEKNTATSEVSSEKSSCSVNGDCAGKKDCSNCKCEGDCAKSECKSGDCSEKIAKTFEEFDKNSDGQLSLEEFTALKEAKKAKKSGGSCCSTSCEKTEKKMESEEKTENQ